MNLYLVGDYGLLILIGTVISAIGVGYYLRSGMNKAQKAREAPEVAPAPPAATAASREAWKRSQPKFDLNRTAS